MSSAVVLDSVDVLEVVLDSSPDVSGIEVEAEVLIEGFVVDVTADVVATPEVESSSSSGTHSPATPPA
jgi:hypothetical protein